MVAMAASEFKRTRSRVLAKCEEYADDPEKGFDTIRLTLFVTGA